MDAALIPARRPPARVHGPWAALRARLFDGWRNSLATVAMAALLAWLLPPLFRWAVADAVFAPDLAACRALDYHAACWGLIAEKHRLILFGRYPYEQQWRPVLALLLVFGAIFASGWPALWRRGRVLAALWLTALPLGWLLMRGGWFGLERVDTLLWGGLPLTVVLSLAGIGGAFPLAVAIALGRRSAIPLVRTLCALYVELIRGVPLITVLFMASFLFPLFMPGGFTLDVLLRVQIALILFSAAYLAETIRAGLQALPRGQLEASAALGLGRWQATRLVVLPQALRLVVPPLVSSLVSTIKDTSLVVIVSLYDLTGALRLAIGDPAWRGFHIEGYLFVGAVYFILCYSLSRYARWLERRLRDRA
jgi:general L-amino acid transport system permease protein